MAKKEIKSEEVEEIKEEIKVEKIEKKEELKYPITSFVEDNVEVRSRNGRGFAFKTFYKFKLEGSFHDKKTMKEWEVLFKKFMTSPV